MLIVFDIGGTTMRIAGSRDGKEFTATPKKIETPRDFSDAMDAFADCAKEVSQGEHVDMVVGGIAGPFRSERCSLLTSPNLRGWVGKPLCDRIGEMLGAPVFVENDAALVGLGEMHRGAGNKSGVGAYITVSTGVGGARYVDGFIDEKTVGFEPGHQIIDAGKALCPECDRPTLEGYVSGHSTKERMGKEPYEIPQEDPLWEHYAKYLAIGLVNTTVHWSPEKIVLGGPMVVGKPRITLTRIQEHFADTLSIFPVHPELVLGTLGDFGGLYGALVYAKQHSR